MSEGQYADGRRIGTWTYYDLNGFDTDPFAPGRDRHSQPLKPARGREAQYMLDFDALGAEVSGQVFIQGDTVPVRFREDMFEFLSQDGRPIGPFPKASFDFELERLFAGVYRRDLMEKQ